MLYLLGGAARAGKSTIARRFLSETGIPYFCLDYLMMGFAVGLPEHGVDPEDDEGAVGRLLWPVVKPLATALVEDGIDYMIEGAQLLPEHAWELTGKLSDQVRSCFVGFAEVDIEAKLREIRRFRGTSDDWLRDYDDGKVREEIQRLKGFSRHLKLGCGRYGLAYFEASTDVNSTAEAVVQYLKG
jgi:hypothetical protein